MGPADFGVGTVSANRAASERAGLMGFLASTLVLRCDLRDDPPFSEWLGRASRTARSPDIAGPRALRRTASATSSRRPSSTSPV